MTPQRFEGLGTITLILAYVTAFFDQCRAHGPDFFAYPDFFTFQHLDPPADYGAFDIFPRHKNVTVPEDTQLTVEAITDRGITILLVPDTDVGQPVIDPVELASARRNIRRCFAYTSSGEVASADLVVECATDLLSEFPVTVLNSVSDGAGAEPQRKRWLELVKGPTVRQSFRELELDEALRRI